MGPAPASAILAVFGVMAIASVIATVVLVVFVNRLIGQHFGERAASLAAALSGQTLADEDACEEEVTARATLSWSRRRGLAHLLLTPRSLFLLRTARTLGRASIAQPAIQVRLDGAVAPQPLASLSVLLVSAPRVDEQGRLVLDTESPKAKLTIALRVKDASAWLQKLAEAGRMTG